MITTTLFAFWIAYTLFEASELRAQDRVRALNNNSR